ncbi:MAG TPA: ComEC/Rec2 family competence protein [Acidimicrobiia bacterium]|nr:ComEC/Rec2 family competence protein [Acidimicrobiia bacterium]
MELGPVVAVVAVVIGILAGERAGAAGASTALVVGAAALGAAWFTHPPARSMITALACALLAFASIGRAMHGQSSSALTAAIDQRAPATLHGVATGDPSGPAYATDLLVRVDTGRGSHRTLLARASGDDGVALRVVEAGDRVVLRGRLAPLGPGAADDRARWRHAVGRLDEAEIVGLSAPRGLVGIADSIRAVIVRGTRPLDPVPRALVAGFLLGDTRGVPPQVIDDFRDSGLSHLLAVSGENVAFVLALAAPLLRRMRLGARTVLALAIVLVFAAMTRFEPSVLRASAMAAIALLATLSGRPASGVRVLAYAVVILLLADPFLLHSVAFVLSCGASAGIACLSQPIAARLRGPRFVREPLAVSIAAQIGVIPVLLCVFGTFPLITPATNLVAAPAAEALGVYGFFASAVAGVVPALGPLAQQPTALLVGWITTIAHLGAAVPFAIDGRGAVGLVAVAAAGASVACLRARRAVSDTPAR